jgi:hypothetical protein
MTITERKRQQFQSMLSLIDKLEAYYIDHINETVQEHILEEGLVSETNDEFMELSAEITKRLTNRLTKM